MPNFLNLPPFTEEGDVRVVVETPRGSRAKFAYDPKLETKAIQQELEKFFIATDELADKTLKIIGWKGPKIATKAIKDFAKSFSRDDK
jgi:inorganic pyrophosphatase